MNEQAKLVNGVLHEARAEARHTIASAVCQALADYHKKTGGHITGIDLTLVEHRIDGLVSYVVLTDISFICVEGA